MDEQNEVTKAGYEWWHSGSKWKDAQDPVREHWRNVANRTKSVAVRKSMLEG